MVRFYYINGSTLVSASLRVSQVEDLGAAIAADEGELKDATTVREREAADFAASEAELVDSTKG